MLTYKTIGMGDPKGKPRVYFTCHPEDFKGTFETLSEDILRYANCAVWYNDAPEDEGAVVPEQDLTQMQLFVMPVTTRLLFTPNAALSRDFPFAIKNTIPVLPILMEDDPVIVEAFNTRCGHLQAISRARRNLTEIPYEEKLKRYLQALLISDETAKKVRDAFDAYIFLSYRKKDRAKAQELMRLIHRDGSCESVAIWYDEFLRPGENFDHSIQRMLEEGDVFTLLVTHNLVKEDNYVLREEYPKAKELEKPVLAVNADKTPAEAVEGAFGEALACVGMEEEEKLHKELREKLREKLSRAARETEGTTPEHKYLMGLAYLGGIDVEVDHERAVRLIQSAAEAGLPEAMERLVTMYRNGEAVDMDYQAAIQWQERLVDVRRAEYQETHGEDELQNVLEALHYLGEYLREQALLEAAGEVYAEMIRLAEASEHRGLSRIAHMILWGFTGSGRIQFDLRKLEKARVKFERALRIGEQLANDTAGTPQARRGLCTSYNNMGNIEREVGHLERAREYYAKNLELSEVLARETGTVKARRDLFISYSNMGNIERALGHLERTRAYCSKGIELSEGLAREMDTVEARRDLSVSYERMGDVEIALSHPECAREYYAKDLKLSEALAKETGTVEARRDLSISHNKMGDVEIALGHPERAREHYAKGLELREALVEETGTIQTRQDLPVSYNKMGDVGIALGHPDRAREYYAKGLKLREALVEETGTIQARRDLSVSYNKMGDVEIALGHPEQAQDYYAKGLELREALAEETGTIQARRDLFISYRKMRDVEFALGNEPAAQAYARKAAEIRARFS